MKMKVICVCRTFLNDIPMYFVLSPLPFRRGFAILFGPGDRYTPAWRFLQKIGKAVTVEEAYKFIETYRSKFPPKANLESMESWDEAEFEVDDE